MGIVDLYMTDFCPFAQRAWLAFGEKESDPAHPQLYNYIEVNFFNPSLPLTQEFWKLSKTVPAGRHEGEELLESMPICYWVDRQYPQNPLQPSSAEGIAQVKSLIEKYTSGEFNVVAPLYEIVNLQPHEQPELVSAKKQQLLAAYRELSRDLTKSGGPYLLGAQFTLADIAIIPFLDRAVTILGGYRAFSVPRSDEYSAYHAYRSAYQSRPAYQVTNADRLPRSIELQPFESVEREAYILEMYLPYTLNLRAEARAVLRDAPAGKRSIDVDALLAARNASVAAARRQRVIKGAAIGAVAAAGIAGIVHFLRQRRLQ